MLELEGLFPAEVLKTASNISQRSILQGLLDLGYINTAQFEQTSAIAQAIIAFRADYRREGIRPEPLDLPAPESGTLNVAEAQLLRRLTGLEGDFIFPRLPGIGEISLYSRIARIRLDLFNADNQSAGDHGFTAADYQFLLAVAAWKGCLNRQELAGDEPARALSALNATGHPGELIRRVWKPCSTDLMVYFFSDQGECVPELTPAFRKKMSQSLPRGSTAFKAFTQNVLERTDHPNEDFLQARIREEINARILRFAQIMQWIDGHYLGKIDEVAGPLTRAAIQEYILDAQLANVDDAPELDEVLAYLGNGYWAFNHVEFFNYLFRTSAEVATAQLAGESSGDAELDFVTELEASYARLNANKADAVQRDFGAIGAKLSHGPPDWKGDNRERPHIRLFNGFKRLFARLRKFVGQLFYRLSQPTNQIKSLVYLLFRKMGDALAVFGRGLSFLCGKRQVVTMAADGSTPAIFTTFHADFDTHMIVSDGALLEQLQSHGGQCRALGEALGRVLPFVATVIKTVLTITTPIGWMRLALLILKEFRQMHVEFQIAA
jgi:hypothetical protein